MHGSLKKEWKIISQKSRRVLDFQGILGALQGHLYTDDCKDISTQMMEVNITFTLVISFFYLFKRLTFCRSKVHLQLVGTAESCDTPTPSASPCLEISLFFDMWKNDMNASPVIPVSFPVRIGVSFFCAKKLC